MLLTNIFANNQKKSENGDSDHLWTIIHDQYGLQDLYNAIYAFTSMPEYIFASTDGESYTMYHNNVVMLDYTFCQVIKKKELSLYKILNNEEPCLLDATTKKNPQLEPYIEALNRQDIKICELISKLDKYETLFDDLVTKIASITNQCNVTLIKNLVNDAKIKVNESFETFDELENDEPTDNETIYKQSSVINTNEINKQSII